MKEVLSENNVNYMYIDVCESVGKLRTFLQVRDTAEAYKETRETRHNVGIPCIMIDEDVIILQGAEHMQELIEKYQLKD